MTQKYFEDVLSEAAAEKFYDDLMEIAQRHAAELIEMDEQESA